MTRAGMTAAALLIALGCSSAAKPVRVLERETGQWTIPGDEGTSRTLDVLAIRVDTGLPPDSPRHLVDVLLARDLTTGLTYQSVSINPSQQHGVGEMLRQSERTRLAEHDGRLYSFWWPNFSNSLVVEEISHRTTSMAEAERVELQVLAALEPGPVPVQMGGLGTEVPVKLERSFTDTGGSSSANIIMHDAVFRDGAWHVTLEGAKKQRAVISFTERHEVLGIKYEAGGEWKKQR